MDTTEIVKKRDAAQHTALKARAQWLEADQISIAVCDDTNHKLKAYEIANKEWERLDRCVIIEELGEIDHE